MKKSMISFIRMSLVLVFMLVGGELFAQTVKGLVSDQSGQAVIGATVLVKDSQNGSVTDIEGKYTLNNVNKGSTIQVIILGYRTESKLYNGESTMDFVLQEDAEMLDEIVVVGYGSMKASNISGSVSSVKVTDLAKSATASVGSMLRGRAAGVNIAQNNAAPGASLDIKLRGGLSGTRPLIVVDGMPLMSNASSGSGTIYGGSSKDLDLININPNDIASIDILKDASAAAIYGSNAAGGVILITTKSGRSERVNVDYSGYVSCQYMSDKPEYLNAKDFMIEQNRAFDELGRGGEKVYTQEEIDAFVGNGTDWLDEVTRIGVMHEHNLTVSAGNDKSSTLFSMSAMDHNAIAKNNDMNRYTARLKTDRQLGKMLRAGVNMAYTHLSYKDVPLGSAQHENSALIWSAMTFTPTIPVKNQDGTYTLNPFDQKMPNPVSLLEVDDRTKVNSYNINGYLEFKPIKDFYIRATAGYSFSDSQHDQYVPRTTLYGMGRQGEASKHNAKNVSYLANAIANYSHIFGDVHDVNIMVGTEYKKNGWDGMGIVASKFPFDGAGPNNIGSSTQEKPAISSYKGSNEMASFFSRINYTLMSRYIFNVNLRVDGSSNFSPKHQWGFFPGASFAWRITGEDWMRNARQVNDLKLRIGFGQTGNAGNLTGINTFYKVMDTAFVPDGGAVNGVVLSKLGNDDLKWETLTDLNLGIDFGFFNSRLTGSLEFYQRVRSDVIMKKSLMSYHEITSIDYNSDVKYRSRGLDLELHSVNIDKSKFRWTTDINFSFYRNTTISRDPEFIPQMYQPYVEHWGNIYGYRTNGIVQMDETYAHLPNSKPGSIVYQDINGYQLDENGEKMRDDEGRYIASGEADGVLDQADKVLLANDTPIPFSFNNTFKFGNWDANIYFYGSLNGWRVNYLRSDASIGGTGLAWGKNVLAACKERWTVDNQSATLPGYAETASGFDSSESDYFLEKAWYLRLDNISIGYTIPQQTLKNKLRSIRAYVALKNIAVFTPYQGMDPETGLDRGAYPNQSSVSFGLDINF